MEYIFIDRNEKFLRIAVLENEMLEKILFKQNEEVYPGEIYKGTVRNIVPAIKCAFIDIGSNKNAYMYIDNRFKNLKLKKGQDIIVQVVKEDLGKKGAKVMNSLTIPGRYCVINNFDRSIKFSRKICSSEFKKLVLCKLRLPDGIGVMIRTNSQKVSTDIIQDELNRLYKIYKDILKKGQYCVKPKLIFDGGGLIGKVLRDKLEKSDFRIYANSKNDYNDIVSFLRRYCYSEDKVEFYDKSKNLFDLYNIEDKILDLRKRKIYLKCGGYIVIDRTEAMYVIDVNSGKNVKGRSMENTVLVTNLQAAEEIVRQIRIRNLSGIILIDFIDMYTYENRQKIIDVLNSGFYNDKNKTVVYPFTELNLVQIARKRAGRTISDYIDESCHLCHGRGRRIKLSYISMLIKNKIDKINEMNIHIIIGDNYKKDIEENINEFLKNIGAENKNIYLTYCKEEYFQVYPLIFKNQIDELKKFKLKV